MHLFLTIVNCKFVVYICKMELKERIIEIMEKSGLTPSEFADKIGVQRSAISHITSGRNNPSLDFLIKIKNEFPEIHTDWLLFGEEKNEELVLSSIGEKQSSEAEKSQPTLFDPTDFEKDNGQKKESQTNAGFTKKNIVKVILLYEDGSFEDFDQKIKKQTDLMFE